MRATSLIIVATLTIMTAACSLHRQSLAEQLIHRPDACLVAHYTLNPKATNGEQIISTRPVVCHGVTVQRASLAITARPYGDLLQINIDYRVTGNASTTVWAAQISGKRECDKRETVDQLCTGSTCNGSTFLGFGVLFDESCPLENNELQIFVAVAKNKS